MAPDLHRRPSFGVLSGQKKQSSAWRHSSMFFGHGERAPLIRPSAGARQTPAKMSVCAGFQIRCGLKTIVQPPKCQHQKKPFDGKLFCNLAFFARLLPPPAHAAGCRGAWLHPAFSIAVGPTRFDAALRCTARFLNFSACGKVVTPPRLPCAPPSRFKIGACSRFCNLAKNAGLQY